MNESAGRGNEAVVDLERCRETMETLFADRNSSRKRILRASTRQLSLFHPTASKRNSHGVHTRRLATQVQARLPPDQRQQVPERGTINQHLQDRVGEAQVAVVDQAPRHNVGPAELMLDPLERLCQRLLAVCTYRSGFRDMLSDGGCSRAVGQGRRRNGRG